MKPVQRLLSLPIAPLGKTRATQQAASEGRGRTSSWQLDLETVQNTGVGAVKNAQFARSAAGFLIFPGYEASAPHMQKGKQPLQLFPFSFSPSGKGIISWLYRLLP